VDVAIAGAGMFGLATALTFAENGAHVVLFDRWGVANARATSNDHTRVWRTAYGPKRLYSRWARESLEVWKRWEAECGEQLFQQTGVLWLEGDDPEFASATRAALDALGIPYESLAAGRAASRFPQFSGIEDRRALWEPLAGVLFARRACLAIARLFERRGGKIETAGVASFSGRRMILEDGRDISADKYVFACGPWLRDIFPSLLGGRIRVTRQEVFYFEPPAPDNFGPGEFPVWLEEGRRAGKEFSYYGMPTLDGRVKLASDERGPEFDPTSGDRTTSPESLAQARDFLTRRLPALAPQRLIDSRVCQYEQTIDSHLIVDRHPDWENVWIAGGGSGHGFKLAPAVANALLREETPDEVRLKR